MKEEISVQQEKMADYQHSITEKEEKIRELSERLQQKLEEKQKIDVGASSTAEAKTVEVTRIRYDMLRMRVKLDEAKRERHQLAIKSDSLEQSIKQLKSMIVSKYMISLYVVMKLNQSVVVVFLASA